MIEKSQKTAVKNTKNKKKRKKCRSQSKDENLLRQSYKKTLNCKESLERLKEKLDKSKMNMDPKDETSSDSTAECALQQSCLEKSKLNSDQILQLESDTCSFVGDVIATTGRISRGRYLLSPDIGLACNEETIRWHNCCNNPAKEQQRIEKYKADRRKRYYDQARNKKTTSRYYAEI